jgi:hypothetical protein
MRISCWINKATNKNSEYVKHETFSQQQWPHEWASILRYTYIVCVVNNREAVCLLRGTLPISLQFTLILVFKGLKQVIQLYFERL